MQLLLALTLTAATVQGTATIDSGALPGCTVTLTSATSDAQRVVTEERGGYRFDGVAPGEYTLRFQLDGLEDAERRIIVADGINDLSPQELELPPMPEIVMSCNGPCGDDPETVWDRPSCRDYELDSALIAALEHNDTSARAALRQRHESAFTFAQKHRIAAALMASEKRYFDELAGHARNALRFHPDDAREALEAWCAKRNFGPDEYLQIATNTIDLIGADPRSRPLLAEALKSEDDYFVYLGILGFACQQHEAALPLIEEALTRLGEDAGFASYALGLFRSEAADRIAWRFVGAEERDSYESFRAPAPEEN